MNEEYYANETSLPSDYKSSPDDDPRSSWVTWTFNIDQPEGARLLKECLDAPNVKTAVREFDEELRRRWKYGEEGAQMMTVEQVRGLLYSTLSRYDVNLDE